MLAPPRCSVHLHLFQHFEKIIRGFIAPFPFDRSEYICEYFYYGKTIHRRRGMIYSYFRDKLRQKITGDYSGWNFQKRTFTGCGSILTYCGNSMCDEKTCTTKTVYTGDIKQSIACGNGQLLIGDKKYVGQFCDNVFVSGCYTSVESGYTDSFEGTFVNGLLHGKGTAKRYDKNHVLIVTKRGIFSHGKFVEGTIDWPYGVFHGNPNGNGSYTRFSDGLLFVGNFCKHILMKGIVQCDKYTFEATRWHWDMSADEGKITYTNGDIYIGHVRNFFTRHGTGVLTCSSGEKFDALWKDDEIVPDNFLCKICYIQEKTTVFLPCRHRGICGTCARKLMKCPFCCAGVKKKVSIPHEIIEV